MAAATKDRMDGVESLYVFLDCCLVRLDLKNYNHNPSSAIPPFPPSPTVVVKYSEVGYPVDFAAMEVVKFESKIYILGGGGDDSKDIYEFDPRKSSFKRCKASLKDPKRMPIMENIEGKIYALQADLIDVPPGFSVFEVLDPSSSDPCWEVLPNPPFYSAWCYDSADDNDVRGHFVLGHKLYLCTLSYELYYFDTRERRWDIDGNMFKYASDYSNTSDYQMLSSLLFPIEGRMVLEDVIISCEQDRFEFPRAVQFYGYLYSSDGCLLVCQRLSDVFSGITSMNLCLRSIILIKMDDGRMCALGYGDSFCNSRLEYVFAVSIFSVSKMPNANVIEEEAAANMLGDIIFEDEVEDKFLKVQVDKQYIFLYPDYTSSPTAAFLV